MRLGLVIDLDTCVGCHACATACKQWNTSSITAPLTDYDPYGKEPSGVWFNRILPATQLGSISNNSGISATYWAPNKTPFGKSPNIGRHYTRVTCYC